MLRVRNCKTFLLAALLIGAAGNAFASGVFSVSETKKVQFADAGYTYNTTYYTWEEMCALVLPEGQRIMEEDEWRYLLQDRTHAYQLFALAQVAGYNGLVILPDYETWELPEGLSFDYQDTQGGWSKNSYSAEDWARMEAAGAVFFPASGYGVGDGRTPTDVGDHGSYWIRTAHSESEAYRLHFDENLVAEIFPMPKTNYYSVRAVTDVSPTPAAPILSEEDEQSEVEAKLAIMRANDFADLHRTLRKAGCFNTLTLPFNVPSIEASPLTGAEAYRFVSAEVEDGSLVLNITKVTNNQLVAGTPYLIQWANTGEVMTDFHFTDVTWDADDNADTNGSGDVLFHGFYGKTHITDENAGFGHHFHLFLLGNNTLYWPTDGNDPAAKMLGFRAWFDIVNNTISGAPVRRDMPARLNIVSSFGGATDIEAVSGDSSLRTKTIEDGTLYILHRGKKYNVQGQIVK